MQIVFDATSAYVHAENSRKVNAQGAMMIDLTPAAIGPYCVPPVNLRQHVGQREMNVNMVTCGGQATIPMVYAVSDIDLIGREWYNAFFSEPCTDETDRVWAAVFNKVRRIPGSSNQHGRRFHTSQLQLQNV